MYSSESAHPRRALTPCPGAVAPSGTRSLACTSWATPGHQDRNQHPLPRAEKQNSLASRRDATSSLLSSLLYPPSSPVC
jgi:hypothetical protein